MEKLIREINAFLIYTAEVREFYINQMDVLIVESPEYTEIENKYIDFLDKCHLTHNEYNHKLANKEFE